MTSTKNVHAHVSTFSRDCDGGHGMEYSMFFCDEEIAEQEAAQGINDFSDIHFMERVMMSVASPYAVRHGMTVEVSESGIQVNEDMDEGYRSADVQWCRDDCEDPHRVTVFDEFAEAMGY